MAYTQISKIQLRRGLQQDLVLTDLGPGEPGFATDTGRLVIGTDQIGPWTDRTVFPQETVEVLTENSTETFARMFDRMNRVVGPSGMAENTTRRPFHEATLAANTTTWTNVVAMSYDNNGALQPLTDTVIVSPSGSGSAKIDYALFNGTASVQHGTLFASHDGNSTSDEASIIDDYVANHLVTITGTPFLSGDVYDSGIQFRVMRVGTSPNQSLRLQYKNATPNSLHFYFTLMAASRLVP